MKCPVFTLNDCRKSFSKLNFPERETPSGETLSLQKSSFCFSKGKEFFPIQKLSQLYLKLAYNFSKAMGALLNSSPNVSCGSCCLLGCPVRILIPKDTQSLKS